MGFVGFASLIALGVAAAVVSRLLGRTHYEHETLFAGAGAVIGAYFGSGLAAALSDTGPNLDGLVVLPALVGAVIFGGIVDFMGRTSPGSVR